VKLVSWNVNGIRAALGRGFDAFLAQAGADVVCLQETKARRDQIDSTFAGYEVIWNAAHRPGYAGTAILTKIPPVNARFGIGADVHDREGRVITAEFSDFFLVNVYVPNSRRALTRLDYRVKSWGPDFLGYLRNLEEMKPVVFCGDMNVAHRELDLARPKCNAKNAGFTPEERASFDSYFAGGFLDTFREFEPSGGHYTWWSYQSNARARNVGWRIDYICISPALRPRLKQAFIWPHVMGSDHCPVGVVLE
jgi:exodeoxyribonuclease III